MQTSQTETPVIPLIYANISNGDKNLLQIHVNISLNLWYNNNQTFFQCINVCQVPQEMLKTSGFALGLKYISQKKYGKSENELNI